MRSLSAASFAGLCLLASCAFAQQVPVRGQYCVSFKIASGKLAVDHDWFLVAPPQIKFEPAIRLTVLQAIAKIGPLSPDLLIDSAWPDYIEIFENWSAANPDRLDLGTLF